MVRRSAAALGAVAVMFAAGCGSDEAPTKAEFNRQANAACAVEPAAGTTTGARDPAAFFRAIVDQRQAALDRLDALEPPDALSDRYDEFTETLRSTVDTQERIVAMIEETGMEPDATQAAEVRRLTDAADAGLARAAKLGEELGIEGCA